MIRLLLLTVLSGAILSTALAAERLRLATTTSTENSGLLTVLNPAFEAQYGIKLDVISVGTGKALRLAKNGDVDLILVHAPAAEQQLVSEGFGIERQPVMYNDFVILGPSDDPAGIRQAQALKDALSKLITQQHAFISRGDHSGTHHKEQSLWRAYNKNPSGNWYLSVGQGMGMTLRIADNKQAYTLSDRGTYLAYKDHISLEVVFEHDPLLANPYHIILINPAKHPHTKIELARQYSTFIRSKQTQQLISNFKVNGEVLFHPSSNH